MTSFTNINEMNEDYGFSYFEFEDTKKTQVIAQKSMNSMIEWHDDVTQVSVDSVVPNARHFGILRISTPKIPISTTPLAILLNIDGSSSMDEIGSDKLTKINHIKHTLKNMIHLLIDKMTETPNICIYISILLFTHDVKNILQRIKTEQQFDYFKGDFILLNHQSMHLILEEIDRIHPWGCTNIELSLKNAKTKINDFKQKNPEFRIAHIQLTDGQATAGKKRAIELSSYVDTSYRNIFVGYGEDHDSHLLASLGEIYPTCDYRFIDNIERTGLVYGELMYHLLYPHNDEPILIKMSPGTKIYNWKTNQWSSTLLIPPLSSDTEKVFQIIVDDTDISKENVWADLYYTNNVFVPIDTAITLPSLITLPIKMSQVDEDVDASPNSSGGLRPPPELVVRRLQGTEAPWPKSGASFACAGLSSEEATRSVCPLPNLDTILPVNLTKYLLRQLTQECLYLVRNNEINRSEPFVGKGASVPCSLLTTNSGGDRRSSDEFGNTHGLDPLLIRSTNKVSYPYYPSNIISIEELKHKISLLLTKLIYHRDGLIPKSSASFACSGLSSEEDVSFIQTLIDDLQTASLNLGSKQNFMYTTARQTSQGSQHTYSPYNTRYNNTNTFDIYNRQVSQPTEHNQRQTSYTNRDILDMMTQVQGMNDSMYVSDVENDILDSHDYLSQEPVVYNTQTIRRINSESTVSTLLTQLDDDK